MYDIIIIGAGPAGLSAAVYGQRGGKNTLILDGKGYGGQIINTPEVENYPGIKSVSGFQLASQMYEQAVDLGAEVIFEKAETVEDCGSVKVVRTQNRQYEAKAVIFATGAKNRPLGLDREAQLTGAGVSYCAACDGAFFRGRDVAVVGGGNTALEDAEVLSGIANKVYLIHRRDTFRGDLANVKRLQLKDNIEFLLDTVPVELTGEHMVEGLRVRNVKTEEEQQLDVSGVFVAIGQMPDNKAFENVVPLDRTGYIEAGESCRTERAGIFTAGDCRTKKVRQLATAAADGAVAALAAIEYINGMQK